MRTNKFSIGRLRGVHVSSIVKWGYQDNFKTNYFFFYGKISRAQKHSQAYINQQNKNKWTKNNKGNGFLRAQTSKKVKVACFAFWCFLCKRNLFVKKKVICLEIVLIPSFHYTTLKTVRLKRWNLVHLRFKDFS